MVHLIISTYLATTTARRPSKWQDSHQQSPFLWVNHLAKQIFRILHHSQRQDNDLRFEIKIKEISKTTLTIWIQKQITYVSTLYYLNTNGFWNICFRIFFIFAMKVFFLFGIFVYFLRGHFATTKTKRFM